eukprot:TRINITY_DN31218_c0_g1_i1.p1 TRINITY_DN31218_c0_g1~~TRINITY_DN31218_c0_g1_i1.p1  ORF type:complete len:210 (-),score=40.21 TRINITY_DN31218_c0_g1_i1:97-726(-)
MSRGGEVTTVYVGNLPDDIRRRDLQYLFEEFGNVRHVDIKQGAPNQAFAFLDFDDDRGAWAAVRQLNGYDFEGELLRVELKSGFDPNGYANPGPGRPGKGAGRGTMYVPPERVASCVVVTGLTPLAAWQDLKDHMRQAGDVAYCELEKPGFAVVRYHDKADREVAVKKLDKSTFQDKQEEVEIRVRTYEDYQKTAKSSPNRSRSPRRRS